MPTLLQRWMKKLPEWADMTVSSTGKVRLVHVWCTHCEQDESVEVETPAYIPKASANAAIRIKHGSTCDVPLSQAADEAHAIAQARTLERVRRIRKGLRGGSSDTYRCVCAEKETGRYADTPHTHYIEPPFACARCSCTAYDPAVP